MTLKQLIIQFDNQNRYDYWWRSKHNIPFNSAAHREVSQLDIAFEYLESQLESEAVEKYKEEEDKKEALKKTGKWIKKSVNKKKNIDAFDKIDLSKL